MLIICVYEFLYGLDMYYVYIFSICVILIKNRGKQVCINSVYKNKTNMTNRGNVRYWRYR